MLLDVSGIHFLKLVMQRFILSWSQAGEGYILNVGVISGASNKDVDANISSLNF